MSDHARERRRMVEHAVAQRGVRSTAVLEAMRQTPRHRFVRSHLRAQAYGDHALPIGHDQTISQPYVIARMLELLDVGPDDSVLEIGTGSGYQTALLGRLARRVYSLERVPELARTAIERIRALGHHNVKIQVFDGTVGWSEVAPFDRIVVGAGAPRVPRPLLDQLRTPGRLVIPEGDEHEQRLIVYDKSASGVERRERDPVVFVPLVGRHGWSVEPSRSRRARARR